MAAMDDRSLLPGWDALPEERLTPTATPASTGPPTAPGTFGLRILAVSEVARAIREAVRADPRLTDVWVEGEVGRVTVSSAGHAYFTLKDARSTLNCVWFSDERARSAFQPQAGLRIVVHGRVDLFEQQGAVQLYVESIQPAGFGDLAIRFEALKARLAAEGLFDPSRKRPLPQRPGDDRGDHEPDRRRLARHRDCPDPALADDARPARAVQGPGRRCAGEHRPGVPAAREWVAAAARDGRADDLPQLTILARGGGSLEDLWSFNDERVVRAVVGHPLPVVCGVGHEVDVTLADFAADVRAATPSAAAELVVPDRADWMAAFRRAGERTARSRRADARGRPARARGRAAGPRPARSAGPARRRPRAGRAAPGSRGAGRGRRDRAARRRARGRRRPRRRGPLLVRLAAARSTLDAAASALAVLDPQATLERGYAIVRRAADERILRAPADAPAGTGARDPAGRRRAAGDVGEHEPMIDLVLFVGDRDRRSWPSGWALVCSSPAGSRAGWNDDEEPDDAEPTARHEAARARRADPAIAALSFDDAFAELRTAVSRARGRRAVPRGHDRPDRACGRPPAPLREAPRRSGAPGPPARQPARRRTRGPRDRRRRGDRGLTPGPTQAGSAAIVGPGGRIRTGDRPVRPLLGPRKRLLIYDGPRRRPPVRVVHPRHRAGRVKARLSVSRAGCCG